MIRAVILASQRSGSTFLAKSLNAHSQVRCLYTELFQYQSWRESLALKWQAGQRLADFYEHGLVPSQRVNAWREHSSRWGCLEELDSQELAPVMSLKVMENQILSNPVLDRQIVRDTGIRVIHLRRRNLLKQHVSNMLNRQRKRHSRPVHSTRSLSPATVDINPRRAIWHMRWIRALHDWYARRLSQHPRVELLYETMIDASRLSDWALGLVCELLDLEPEPLGADLVKVNPDSLCDIVTNYDELVKALSGTEFEEFLE